MDKNKQNSNPENIIPFSGLTPKEIRERVRAGLVNKAVQPPSKTVPQIVASNVFTYFNFVFIIIALVLISVGSYRDLTFLPIILANTFIGIFQEIRAKIVLDHLMIMNAPTARVVRDKKLLRVDAETLVKDDIVMFKAGDQIVADAVVVDGNVSVNEALLTGESDEINKTIDSELMSGSFIVSGKCFAKLTKVGAESYINQLTLQAKHTNKREQSEIIRSLNKIVRIAGIAIIPIAIILFTQSYFVKQLSSFESVRSVIAAIIGMIPEGLFLLASVALALSAMRLGKKKVLLHDMKSIETLARVNVLCVDKTGTITSNDMEVSDIEVLDTEHFKANDMKELLSDFAYAQDSDNITMTALKSFFNLPTGRKAKSVQAFSSEFKYSGVSFEDGAYVIGAPEFILKDNYDKYKGKIEKHSRKGERVLIFGKYDGTLNGKALTKEFHPIGLVLLINPIRENAVETFKFFKEQGVNIKVISGDNPITVSEIAKKAGIDGAEHYIDASTLTTDEAIDAAMQEYVVFGRVTPDQKRKFVKSLQKQKFTVAMTGDGVNDVLALRDADCSVAMASGSDAAAQAAQVVLLESDFSRMPEVVMEGRRVVNNLERSGSLFLVKNVFSLLTSILAICFSVKYPLVPSQISLISTFTIGIPAFLLSQAPNSDLIRGNFVENILRKAVPGGLTDVFMIASTLVIGSILGLSGEDISTSATLVVAAVGFAYIYSIIKPLNPYKSFIIFGCLICLILCTAFLPTLFSIEHLSLAGWIMTSILIVACPGVLFLITHAVGKLWELIRDIHRNHVREKAETTR